MEKKLEYIDCNIVLPINHTMETKKKNKFGVIVGQDAFDLNLWNYHDEIYKYEILKTLNKDYSDIDKVVIKSMTSMDINNELTNADGIKIWFFEQNTEAEDDLQVKGTVDYFMFQHEYKYDGLGLTCFPAHIKCNLIYKPLLSCFKSLLICVRTDDEEKGNVFNLHISYRIYFKNKY